MTGEPRQLSTQCNLSRIHIPSQPFPFENVPDINRCNETYATTDDQYYRETFIKCPFLDDPEGSDIFQDTLSHHVNHFPADEYREKTRCAASALLFAKSSNSSSKSCKINCISKSFDIDSATEAWKHEGTNSFVDQQRCNTAHRGDLSTKATPEILLPMKPSKSKVISKKSCSLYAENEVHLLSSLTSGNVEESFTEQTQLTDVHPFVCWNTNEDTRTESNEVNLLQPLTSGEIEENSTEQTQQREIHRFRRWNTTEDDILKNAVAIQRNPPYNWKHISAQYFFGTRTDYQVSL